MNPFEQVKAAIKKNPKVALAAAAGGGFLLIKSKGKGSSSSSDTTGSGVTTVVQPVDSGFNSESAADSSNDPSLTEPAFPVTPAPDPAPPPEIPDAPETPPKEAPTPAPTPAPATLPNADGITVAGHFFKGATGHTQVGKGKNAGGEYTIQLISFPTKTERWWHYFSGKNSGKWSGPHTGTGNTGSAAPAPAKPSAPAPAKAPSPAPAKAPAPAPAKAPTPVASTPKQGAVIVTPKKPAPSPGFPNYSVRHNMYYKVQTIGGVKYNVYTNGTKVKA